MKNLPFGMRLSTSSFSAWTLMPSASISAALCKLLSTNNAVDTVSSCKPSEELAIECVYVCMESDCGSAAAELLESSILLQLLAVDIKEMLSAGAVLTAVDVIEVTSALSFAVGGGALFVGVARAPADGRKSLLTDSEAAIKRGKSNYLANRGKYKRRWEMAENKQRKKWLKFCYHIEFLLFFLFEVLMYFYT